MNATRSFLVLLACFYLSACGAANSNKKDSVDILGKLELDRVAYSTARSEAQAASDKAKVAQREADATEVARVKSAQALALSLEQASRFHESKMREYWDEVCKYDPGRCGGPTNPVSHSEVSVPFVDGKVNSFSEGGFSRLPGSSYPDGWQVIFKGNGFVLVVSGRERAFLPAIQDSVGKCFRAQVPEYGEFKPIACP